MGRSACTTGDAVPIACTGGGTDSKGGGGAGVEAGAPAAGVDGWTGASQPNPWTAAATCSASGVSTARSGISTQIQQHHDRVFLILGVVVRADADGPKAEPPVEPHRGGVRTPHLQRHESALPAAADLDDVREQAGRVARPPGLWVRREVQQMNLVGD